MTSASPSLRIVLVEDCDTDAELLALVFADAGMDVAWTCTTTESGLRAALATPVDLVISDYHLPGFDGLHALAIARELAPGVPFVFCCGEVDAAFDHAARGAGARACLLKREMWKMPEAVRQVLREG